MYRSTLPRLKNNASHTSGTSLPSVCSFNKYGHCKFQKKCRKMHEDKIYESLECEPRKCNLRHSVAFYLSDEKHLL